LDVIDITLFPPELREPARQRHAGEYVSYPQILVVYLAFNVGRAPFDDPRVRQAFALATDRETLTDLVMMGYRYPASGGFVPRGMPGHSPGIAPPYDPERARQLLTEAGYPEGRGFPKPESVTAPGGRLLIPFLSAQWKALLGVDIEWQAPEMSGLYERTLAKQPPDMMLWAWAADYPDPDNFLRVGFPWWETEWHNRAYDSLVEEARRLTDQEERMKLYRQADTILMQDVPVVPLNYGRSHLLVKPWVTRFPTSAMGGFFCKDVIIQPH
jgi:oligopeptide transport system substrate-binding protein